MTVAHAPGGGAAYNRPMISREPTLERLATASACCSSPSAWTKPT